MTTPIIAYEIVLFARSLFSSSPPPVSIKNPAYIIMTIVMIAINQLRKTIIFAMMPSDPVASNARWVQSIGTPKILFPPHFAPPYAIRTTGSAIIIMIKPNTEPKNTFRQSIALSSSPIEVTIR